MTVAGQTVIERDISELIKAQQYLAGRQAASVPGFGLRFQQIIPSPPGGC